MDSHGRHGPQFSAQVQYFNRLSRCSKVLFGPNRRGTWAERVSKTSEALGGAVPVAALPVPRLVILHRGRGSGGGGVTVSPMLLVLLMFLVSVAMLFLLLWLAL